jgi:TPP-dependent 2-oxoacid decarboxylase
MTMILSPNTVNSFKVEIEFEGLLFEATCEVIKMETPDTFRCQLRYNEQFPEYFGIYHSDYTPEMVEEAKNRFRLLLRELPKGKRCTKK